MTYLFDGTYNGFLCGIFEYFEYKDTDVRLEVSSNCTQATLFGQQRRITTDITKSMRVQIGLRKKVGSMAAFDFYKVFLSENQRAWQACFHIICHLFTGQPNILHNYGDQELVYFKQTVKSVNRECHRMKAFVRFHKTDNDSYFAHIEPDFNVLPLIADFFRTRYADQQWLIYDEKRKYGIFYNEMQLTEVIQVPEQKMVLSTDKPILLNDTEIYYQSLWLSYYKSTNIEERRNIQLHLRHLPKRYWKYLVEKQCL